MSQASSGKRWEGKSCESCAQEEVQGPCSDGADEKEAGIQSGAFDYQGWLLLDIIVIKEWLCQLHV